MHEPTITVVGNVGRPPRQRVIAGGTIVADFRIANTPRRLDKVSGTWSDGATTWYGVTCWRALAENAAQSLKTGDRVVVTGRLTTRTWQTEQGEERSGLEIDASAVGFDLSRGPALQQRPERTADHDAASQGADPWTDSPGADPMTGEVAAQAA